MKKILYVDMDNVLVDFPSGVSKISNKLKVEYEDRLDEVPGIFSLIGSIKENIPGTSSKLSSYSDCNALEIFDIPEEKSTRTLSISTYKIFLVEMSKK